ncbi:MAG: Gfo/Idh/MocA family oxidoreductase [Planctomycetes bacterium]|nr:Gfo/Idh/MocA family oxidoreductase [Planctomycetota bacterium]
MPLRLAMLGMWHVHADGIVRQVAEHPDEFTLVGFHDGDAAVVANRVREWTPRLGALRVFDDPAALVREPIDGVVVEGRVSENLGLARLALEAGKPVMLEKPAGVEFDEFRRLIDLARAKNLHVQMIYLFRYMNSVREMLKRARTGELGDIYHYRARLPKDLPSYERFVNELAGYGGGIFFEMAGHVIDMMIAMLGAPRRVTPFLAHHHREGPATFIDNAVAMFEYPGAWASIEVPAMEVAPHSRRIEVFGTEGAIVIPHLGSGHLKNRNVQPIEIYRRGDDDWQTLELPANPLQISDLREFAAVLASNKQPDFSLEHDLSVQETLLRASGMWGGCELKQSW